MRLTGAIAAALLIATSAFSAIRFAEVAAKAGLSFRLETGATGEFHQLELTGGGVAAFDYNNDGCIDIFFANGADIALLEKSSPKFHNRLFRNNCDMTFTDVTEQSGLAGTGYSMAVAAADFDNDGWTDLFVTGVNRNVLYRNLGNGRFAEVTSKAGIGNGKNDWSISAGWLDYDNDGWLDLFVSKYVPWDGGHEIHCGTAEQRFYCHPNAYRGAANQLLHNNRDGTFTDVSLASGIASHIGKAMGVAFGDADGDGFPDIYVANDSVRSFLFHNLRNGTFEEIGLERGVALREDGAAIAGMGVDFRDFNNDGLPDLIVSGIIHDSFPLFRNLGNGKGFEDEGQQTGLLLATRQLTGWSLGMYDFDNDGWKDLFFVLSHLPGLDRYLGDDAALPNRVFRNLQGKRFEDVSSEAGKDFADRAMHRGAAFADFNNDGKMDAVVTVANGSAKLFLNVTQPSGHWLAFRLRGTRSNRLGLGATIHVSLADGGELYNHATTSVGYASSSEALVRFGLGPNKRADRVEIHWPGGSVQRLGPVDGDRVVEVKESAK